MKINPKTDKNTARGIKQEMQARGILGGNNCQGYIKMRKGKPLPLNVVCNYCLLEFHVLHYISFTPYLGRTSSLDQRRAFFQGGDWVVCVDASVRPSPRVRHRVRKSVRRELMMKKSYTKLPLIPQDQFFV